LRLVLALRDAHSRTALSTPRSMARATRREGVHRKARGPPMRSEAGGTRVSRRANRRANRSRSRGECSSFTHPMRLRPGCLCRLLRGDRDRNFTERDRSRRPPRSSRHARS
jgi:hypothetical protein